MSSIVGLWIFSGIAQCYSEFRLRTENNNKKPQLIPMENQEDNNTARGYTDPNMSRLILRFQFETPHPSIDFCAKNYGVPKAKN